jgi:hypothetical protein
VVTPGRWELLRALGAMALGPPGETWRAAEALGLPTWTAAEHTGLFVLALPPYASVHLGPDGKLGGEAADRVAGMWRALGLDPPPVADHLGAILALYAELGEVSATALRATKDRLNQAREAVLWEHLWSWAPGYLDAAAAHSASARPWAELTLRALTAEAGRSRPAARLPLALRAAPPVVSTDVPLDDLLDALIARVRAGFILTRADLAAAARDLGLGLRRGERRFALRALMEQNPAGTIRWLAAHARGWASRYQARPAFGADPGSWWAGRAERAAGCLRAAYQVPGYK